MTYGNNGPTSLRNMSNAKLRKTFENTKIIRKLNATNQTKITKE